jgi:hypothetical protein
VDVVLPKESSWLLRVGGITDTSSWLFSGGGVPPKRPPPLQLLVLVLIGRIPKQPPTSTSSSAPK